MLTYTKFVTGIDNVPAIDYNILVYKFSFKNKYRQK